MEGYVHIETSKVIYFLLDGELAQQCGHAVVPLWIDLDKLSPEARALARVIGSTNPDSVRSQFLAESDFSLFQRLAQHGAEEATLRFLNTLYPEEMAQPVTRQVRVCGAIWDLDQAPYVVLEGNAEALRSAGFHPKLT
jgi:hypothetical protein